MDRRDGHVVATYPSMDAAREAVGSLERGGIDASEVSLEGPPARRAAHDPDPRPRDRRVVRHVGSRVAWGAVLGSAAGAAIGLTVGMAVFDGPAALLAAAIAGVIGGGAVGGALGGYGTAAEGEDWELAHEPEPGEPVRVRVRSEDPDRLDRAVRILQEKDPTSLEGPA